MNKAILVGRLTAKPELRYTNSNIPFTRFTLAVNRKFSNPDGSRDADFINCLAWRKTAEVICNYLDKGREVALDGRIQTGSYEDKDGVKRYTTDVVIDDIHFVGSRNDENKKDNSSITPQDFEDSEDPFADFGEAVTIDDNFLD